MTECFCGCGERAVHLHHVVYQQHITRSQHDDRRNMVPVAFRCHGRHHGRTAVYELAKLPDSAFVFAAEALAPGPAYEYLRRRYAGDDPRLDALLSNARDAA